MGQEVSAEEGWVQVLGSAISCPVLIFGHKYGLAALALIAWLSAGSKSGKDEERERQTWEPTCEMNPLP